jgi:hypothetical protein
MVRVETGPRELRGLWWPPGAFIPRDDAAAI